MCRSTTNNADFPSFPRDRDCLKIRAFYLCLIEQQDARRPLPEDLTLVFLPRIDGIELEVNGSKTRPGAVAIVALHRVRSPGSGFVFASTDRVRVGDGARFEAYLGDEVVVKGVFRRNSGGGGWRMECRYANPEEAAASEVWVVAENGVMIREKVKEKRGKRRKRGEFCLRLEEIPEESDGCDCCCCEGGLEKEEEEEEEDGRSDGGDWEDGEMEIGDSLKMEGVRWAVDVGIWVVCLGVGLLITRPSPIWNLWRKRLI